MIFWTLILFCPPLVPNLLLFLSFDIGASYLVLFVHLLRSNNAQLIEVCLLLVVEWSPSLVSQLLGVFLFPFELHWNLQIFFELHVHAPFPFVHETVFTFLLTVTLFHALYVLLSCYFFYMLHDRAAAFYVLYYSFCRLISYSDA